MSYSRPSTKTITVAATTGNGTVVLPAISGSKIRTVVIDAPTDATYDWTLKDSGGYVIYGRVGVSGDATYHMDLPIKDEVVITFTNATNGTYNVRLWDEYL